MYSLLNYMDTQITLPKLDAINEQVGNQKYINI